MSTKFSNRRAGAHMALCKFKLALRDYERVCKVRPNDKDAKTKMTECRKIVQQYAFNKAIAVEEKSSAVADTIDVDSMTVEDKYDGPRLSDDNKITVEFVTQLLEHYRDQKLLHRKYAFQILLEARNYFMSQPTLVNITVSTTKLKWDMSNFVIFTNILNKAMEIGNFRMVTMI